LDLIEQRVLLHMRGSARRKTTVLRMDGRSQ
jgi:hypothetical protein